MAFSEECYEAAMLDEIGFALVTKNDNPAAPHCAMALRIMAAHRDGERHSRTAQKN